MKMTDSLTTPAALSLLLGFLCFSQISAIDIVEVIKNDIDMSSNDGELLFASVVSSRSVKFTTFGILNKFICNIRSLDMVIGTSSQFIQMILIKTKSTGQKGSGNLPMCVNQFFEYFYLNLFEKCLFFLSNREEKCGNTN